MYDERMQFLLEELYDLKFKITSENVNDIIVDDYENTDQLPLLYGIIQNERIDLLEYLISLGLDVNKAHPYQTLFHYIASYSNIDTLRILLEAGADPNYVGANRHSLPHLLWLDENAIDGIKLAIGYGANINYDDGIMEHTPIYGSIEIFSHYPELGYDIIKFLFENGLDVSRSPYPLIAAVIEEFATMMAIMDKIEIVLLKTIKLFLEYCVNPDIDNYKGESCLYLSFTDSLSLLLLVGGATIDTKDKLITIPRFIQENRIRTMSYILEKSLIDIYQEGEHEGNIMTYYEIAKETNNPEMIQLFNYYAKKMYNSNI